MKHAFLALALTILTTSVLADDDGPFAPPCPNCPEYNTRPPYPHTGLWYNPQRSGTGINIDVQNGIMAAVYYGYREDGEPIWYVFSGELERSQAEDAYWELETDLYKASNGEPVNGEYRSPDSEIAGSIHVEVMQRHLLRFSIDGGPYRRMAPQVFGSHIFQPFKPESDVWVPDFRDAGIFENEGWDQTPWVIVQMNPDGQTRYGFGYMSYTTHWGRSSEVHSSVPFVYTIRFSEFPALPESYDSAVIECGPAEDVGGGTHNAHIWGERFNGRTEPICIVWSYAGNPPGTTQENLRRYVMPVGNMGDRRFSAVSEDGWVIEGFRLMYD
ncbi:MAG TPA: hypothetical protein VK972_01805 [Wenzhouxiangella sp.]|nr:hypothetical protein [Wenzhouxiangella sp.]